jgi:tetratricopeptide (TPR) repeat protein
MRRLHGTLIILGLLAAPLLSQTHPSELLREALLAEDRGEFEAADQIVRVTIGTGQLSGAELGRAYSILGVACQEEGHLSEAQLAFDRSLRMLEPDSAHIEDYAAALENYGGFYADMGQVDVAATMWGKAFHLRERVGDPTGLTLSLVRLTELALGRRQLREARRYLRQAMNEAMLATDLGDQDRALLAEMQGWLAIAEHHASKAIFWYQRALDLVENRFGRQHWLTGWEYMLRGTAYARSGDLNNASADMRTALAILEPALGRNNPKYFASAIAYSRVLDRIGLRVEAAQMRAQAEKASQEYYAGQCPGCTINTAAFR